MATRMEAIAEVFNGDADFEAYTLEVRRNELPVLQEEETQRAQALALLVSAGETLANAYRILGFDLPDGYEVSEAVPVPETVPVVVEPVKSQLWHDDARRYRTWRKNHPDRNVDAFNSNELSYLDKIDIMREMNRNEVAQRQDASFPSGDADDSSANNGKKEAYP
jgi:hypothetical protein